MLLVADYGLECRARSPAPAKKCMSHSDIEAKEVASAGTSDVPAFDMKTLLHLALPPVCLARRNDIQLQY